MSIQSRELTACGALDRCYLKDRNGNLTPMANGGSLAYAAADGVKIDCTVAAGTSSGYDGSVGGTWINVMTAYDGTVASPPSSGDYPLRKLAQDWGAPWECKYCLS